jgi:hypothetical protein
VPSRYNTDKIQEEKEHFFFFQDTMQYVATYMLTDTSQNLENSGKNFLGKYHYSEHQGYYVDNNTP